MSSLQLVGGLLFFLSSLRLKRNWQLMDNRMKTSLMERMQKALQPAFMCFGAGNIIFTAFGLYPNTCFILDQTFVFLLPPTRRNHQVVIQRITITYSPEQYPSRQQARTGEIGCEIRPANASRDPSCGWHHNPSFASQKEKLSGPI